MKKINRFLAAFLSLSMAFGFAAQPVGASAGEDPPPITDQTFPDPDSFSYDDVEVNFAKALQYSLTFYDANKCGAGITDGFLEWRGDCHVEDYKIPLQPLEIVNEQKHMYIGTDLTQEFIDEYRDILDPDGDGFVDLGGGMHDAGDHVKFGLPGSYAASTVGWGYYEFRDAYIKAEQQEHVEDILRWFNDFYMKATFLDEDGKVIAYCYQVAEGDNDHNYWNPPELQDMDHFDDFARPAYFATADVPASDCAAGAAASLAINYLNFKDTDPEYAEKSLKTALALYDFAVETHTYIDSFDEEYSDKESLGYGSSFYDSSYAWDELSWAAVWLYECTGNYDYIDSIISLSDTPNADGSYDYTGYMKRIIRNTGNIWQNIWVHCWDTVWGGVFAKLAPITNTARDWYIFRWNLEFWSGLPHAEPGAPADHLWETEYQYTDQISNDTDKLSASPAGFSVLNPYGSARYNTAAQLCALVYQKETAARGEEDSQFSEWAKSQMEYIMGKNPMNRCYIVGYAENSASHPHHRASHASTTLSMDDPVDQTHVLWGALVGGPDDGDWHRDITADFVYNEVAVDYNAGFTGACAGLYNYFGTPDMKPQADFPPKEEEKQSFFVEALVNQENTERTQFTVRVTSAQTQPPAYLNGFKARYYFNISELLEHGQSIDDVSVEIYYDQIESDTKGEYSSSVTGPHKVDDETYYIEMDWGDYKFFGTRDIQLGLIAAQDSEFKSNWDPTNDYSREGLEKSDFFGETLNIPLYYNGKLVYGNPVDGDTEPPVTEPSGNPSDETGSVNYGDVNGDGKVDVTDLSVLAIYLADGAGIADSNMKAADVDGSGKVNLGDLARLRQYLSKIIEVLGPKK
ncbi:MAG: glycoside hydrolase family 9 protein [Oscillospiraceae bacterium]|nr:glycoside hydrolase family 9 protein [Oscillospiraceae bacterium]